MRIVSLPPPPGSDPEDEELSEERRERIWARVVSELEARGIPLDEPLVEPDRAPPPTPARVVRRPATVLAAAAAVVAAVALGAALWAGAPRSEGHAVAAGGSATTTAAPERSELAALADAVIAAEPVVLGPPGPAYAHRVVVASTERADGTRFVTREETWVDRQGTGRRTSAVLEGGEPERSDDRYTAPGSLDLGFLTYDALLRLPTAPDALAAALTEAGGGGPDEQGLVPSLVADLLALPVVPPAVRAAAIRLLDAQGFEVVGADARTLTLRLGAGPEVQTLVLTREAVAVEVAIRSRVGGPSTRTYSEVDLRATVDSA